MSYLRFDNIKLKKLRQEGYLYYFAEEKVVSTENRPQGKLYTVLSPFNKSSEVEDYYASRPYDINNRILSDTFLDTDLKSINHVDYLIIAPSELINDLLDLNKSVQTTEEPLTIKWYLNSARWGIIIFCAIHLFYELFIGNSKAAAVSVVMNYVFSMWFIKYQIKNSKKLHNPYFMGLASAAVVFLIRLMVGTLIINTI